MLLNIDSNSFIFLWIQIYYKQVVSFLKPSSNCNFFLICHYRWKPPFSQCVFPHETWVKNPSHISCLIGNREEFKSTLRQLHHWLCSLWNLLNIWQYYISLNLDFYDRIFAEEIAFFSDLVRFSQFCRWQLLSKVLQGSHKNDWKYSF